MRRGKPITSHITCPSVSPKMFAHHLKVYCRFVHMHRLSSPLPLPPCRFVHVHEYVAGLFMHVVWQAAYVMAQFHHKVNIKFMKPAFLTGLPACEKSAN